MSKEVVKRLEFYLGRAYSNYDMIRKLESRIVDLENTATEDAIWEEEMLSLEVENEKLKTELGALRLLLKSRGEQ